jgi:hypothetical protein
MRSAQQKVPERWMPLTVDDTQHLGDIGARQRKRICTDLVSPECVARQEPANQQQPENEQDQAIAAIGVRVMTADQRRERDFQDLSHPSFNANDLTLSSNATVYKGSKSGF